MRSFRHESIGFRCCSAFDTCSDGKQDGNETGVDCGGSCPACAAPCSAATYQAETMFQSTGASTPGGWNIWTNGFISTNHTFIAGPKAITVRAKGEQAQGVWPHMVVSVGGAVIGDVFVTATDWTTSTAAAASEIRVAFDNDVYAPPADRNLLVDSVAVACPPSGP